jgi:Uma2 family endonuclease
MPDVLLEQRRITADEYHAMAEAGILGEDDRVELLDGKIIAMSPTGGSHIGCVNRLTRVLVERTSPDIIVSVQNPVRLDPHWEPEPDVALLRPGEPDAVPTADRVLLLIEVADTTLAKDRTVKVPQYARAGIPEVWLVALEDRYVEVYRRPSSDGYAEMRRYGPGETVAPSQLSAFEALPVDDILRG